MKGDMSASTSIAAPQPLPRQAAVMQMAMGGWVARAISEILKLHVPDTLQANGLMTARQLVERGLQVNAGALERVMRACASVGSKKSPILVAGSGIWSSRFSKSIHLSSESWWISRN